jgi:hypothetical protein
MSMQRRPYEKQYAMKMKPKPATIELLGLPAVGKSWVLSSLARETPDTQVVFVRPGWGSEKIANMMRSLLREPSLLFRSGATLFAAKARPHLIKRQIIAILKFHERVDRLRKLINQPGNGDKYVDEGVAMAIWSIFYDLDYNEKNKKKLRQLTDRTSFAGLTVCYVSCGKDEHVQRMRGRDWKARFQTDYEQGNGDAYQRGRDWMAFLLRTMRQRGIRPRMIRNQAQ